MSPKFVPEQRVGPLLGSMLRDRRPFAVRRTEGQQHLAPGGVSRFEPPGARAVEPLKCLLFGPRYDAGPYFEDMETSGAEPRAVVGAAACDLAALKVLDHVFLEGDYVDPGYRSRREKTLIVSCDCTEPREVCFCTFPEGRPHPEDGFDLNLSPVDGGCVLEAGSEVGRELLEREAGDLPEASGEQMNARDRRRQSVEERVSRQVREAGLDGPDGLQRRVRRSRGDELWADLAEQCVECGACNFICPTCHCFLLVDLQAEHGFRRFRNWDSCQYPGFAREASGASPRPERAERLQGRLQKKFDFIRQDAGVWGCVGCGRCIEACAGQIDVRETLKELTNG
ncbi:MAG: 4Fe-4S dicluster domain-containing protein [Planctomycetota bacterium]